MSSHSPVSCQRTSPPQSLSPSFPSGPHQSCCPGCSSKQAQATVGDLSCRHCRQGELRPRFSLRLSETAHLSTPIGMSRRFATRSYSCVPSDSCGVRALSCCRRAVCASRPEASSACGHREQCQSRLRAAASWDTSLETLRVSPRLRRPAAWRGMAGTPGQMSGIGPLQQVWVWTRRSGEGWLRATAHHAYFVHTDLSQRQGAAQSLAV